MSRVKLVMVTTVPITLKSILLGQPNFLSKNFQVEVVSSDQKELYDVGENEQVKVHAVNMERGISLIKDFFSIIKMILILRKIKPDIIHSYTPKAGLVAMIAGFVCGVPVRIHTFTGLIFPTSTGFKRQILIWVDRLICVCATNIIPEGNGVKQDLLTYGITKKSLLVIGHGNIAGVDTSCFERNQVLDEAEALKQQLGISDDIFLFCFVGRFTQDKGFFELFEAFKLLPDKAYLLLVGEQDERLPLPAYFKQEMDNHPRILQTGFVVDVRPALAISDVLVLPSYREGFPNTPLQAGSMELPSIVTNINGSNEIIQHNVNGWIVDVKDSQALAKAMNIALNSSNIVTMGQEARRQVKEKFERLVYLNKLLEFYNSLTK